MVCLNKCPFCQSLNKLVIRVDAYDTNFLEGDPNYDTTIAVEIDSDLKVKEPVLPSGVYTFDKDRVLECTNCGKDETSSPEMREVRDLVREKNEGWI